MCVCAHEYGRAVVGSRVCACVHMCLLGGCARAHVCVRARVCVCVRARAHTCMCTRACSCVFMPGWLRDYLGRVVMVLRI